MATFLQENGPEVVISFLF